MRNTPQSTSSRHLVGRHKFTVSQRHCIQASVIFRVPASWVQDVVDVAEVVLVEITALGSCTNSLAAVGGGREENGVLFSTGADAADVIEFVTY